MVLFRFFVVEVFGGFLLLRFFLGGGGGDVLWLFLNLRLLL